MCVWPFAGLVRYVCLLGLRVWSLRVRSLVSCSVFRVSWQVCFGVLWSCDGCVTEVWLDSMGTLWFDAMGMLLLDAMSML